MKIEENFYTISENEFQWLCKQMALRFQKGYEETEFLIFYHDKIKNLIETERISALTYQVFIKKNDEE